MIFECAKNRVNNIKWENEEKNASEIDCTLGWEFLQRLAKFYKKTSIKPLLPGFSNIAKLLGDDTEFDFTLYYNDKTKEHFNGRRYTQGIIFEYYLQISLFAEKHSEAKQYLDVYEPLIEICERGGGFNFRSHHGRELEIENIVYIPLANWYERTCSIYHI